MACGAPISDLYCKMGSKKPQLNRFAEMNMRNHAPSFCSSTPGADFPVLGWTVSDATAGLSNPIQEPDPDR